MRVVRWVLALLLLVVVALGVTVTLLGRGSPGDDSVDAGVARDMIDHHAQAVNMATIMQKRTDDADIRYLATDIALGQSDQMGQMQGWLDVWGLSVGRSGRPMQWMTSGGHSGMAGMQVTSDGRMPGMATQAQVNQLSSLPVKQADVQFLTLMIAHHRGGVAMAQAALDRTDTEAVDDLMRTIVQSQTSEIQQMQQMLTRRGAPAA